MKRRINGIINRLSTHNVPDCCLQLLRLNLVRGRALFCKALLRAQLASPALSPVFAAVVAVIGSRLPEVAELLVLRLIAQLKAAYANQDRVLCFATARFVAQLFNQHVVTDLLILQFLSTCMLDPSDGSVELAVVTLRECSVLLAEKSPKALEDVFQRLRELFHDGDLSPRAQVMIENLMLLRRKKFANAAALDPNLDLLEDEDIITHFASLEDDDCDVDLLYDWDSFQFDPEYEANERRYDQIMKDVLGAAFDPASPNASTVDNDALLQPDTPEGNLEERNHEGKRISEKPTDMTEADLIDFRRTIYLTLGSGLSYEEWAHKLIRLMSKNKGRELELCRMIIECCSEEKTFLRSYGLLGQRFCLFDPIYASQFDELFATQYATIHRFGIRKIRNIANFYASLLASEALKWNVFQVVRIVEEETTSSSRMFLKILFQEISRTLGLTKMKQRFKQAEVDGHFTGVLPIDNAENSRFAINFFTTIELGYVTDDLREKLKSLPEKPQNPEDGDDSSSLSSSSLSSSSLSSSSLSASSGEGGKARSHRPNSDSKGSKRPQEQTSPPLSERPLKVRRQSVEPNDGSQDRRSVLDRREVSLRGSPHGSSVGRRSLSYDEVEQSNRAYINASTLATTKRVAQGPHERLEERSLSTKAKSTRESPYKYERSSRGEQRSYSSSEHSVKERDRLESDHFRYGDELSSRGREGSSARHSRERKKKRSRRSRRRSPCTSRGNGSAEAFSDGSDHSSEEDRRRRRRRRRDHVSSDYYYGRKYNRSASRSYQDQGSRSQPRDKSSDLSDGGRSLRSRSRSPPRHRHRRSYDRRSKSVSSESSGDGYYARRSSMLSEERPNVFRREFSPVPAHDS